MSNVLHELTNTVPITYSVAGLVERVTNFKSLFVHSAFSAFVFAENTSRA